MTISNPSVKSLVIQSYLNGKSRDQISKETGLSAGKTSNIIADWKKGIKIPNVDELREFAVTVKKSRMTIDQCARGYKIAKLMDNLGIVVDDYNQHMEEDYSATSSTNYEKKIDFSTFVQDIYINCVGLKIQPSDIFSWIKDLLDYRSCLIYDDDTRLLSLTSQQNQNKCRKDEYDKDNIKSILSSNHNTKSYVAQSQLHSNNDLNLDDFDKSSFNTYKPDNTFLLSDVGSNTLKDSLKIENIKIPFVSQLSFFIAQKKREGIKFETQIKNLKQDIKILENEKNKVINDLKRITANKKSVLLYINWFYKLKRELWENYSITIEQDIKRFSKVIADFKEHGYDAHQIIKEYQRSTSIKAEIKALESHIVNLSNQRESLNNTVLSLQAQIEIHKQTMDVYYQLEVMGFGLKELKKLWNTVWEIGYSNNISSEQAYLKFFKDIEEEYDNKVGFEIKVQEKKRELYQLKNQLNTDRLALQLQPYIGTSLQKLFQNGVSEEDIINMNDIVTKFSKDNTSTSFPFNKQDANDTGKGDKDLSLNINDGNSNNRTKIWKLFIDYLEKFRDIQLQIKEQIENLNKIKKELDFLNKQKQEVTAYLQVAISFINEINHRISYLKGFINNFDNDIKKINIFPRYSPLLLVFITYTNIQKEEKEDDKKDKK